jgi:hypothetical protein
MGGSRPLLLQYWWVSELMAQGHKHRNREIASPSISISLLTSQRGLTTRRTSCITRPLASTKRLKANTIDQTRFLSIGVVGSLEFLIIEGWEAPTCPLKVQIH